MSRPWGGGCNCCCRIWNVCKGDWRSEDYSLWEFGAGEAYAVTGTTAQLLSNDYHDAGFSLVVNLERSSDSGNAAVFFAYQASDDTWRVDVTAAQFWSYDESLICRVYDSTALRMRYFGVSRAMGVAVISAGDEYLAVHFSPTAYVVLSGFSTTGGLIGLSNTGGETTKFMAFEAGSATGENGTFGMTGYATSGDAFGDFSSEIFRYAQNSAGLANCQKIRNDYTPETPCYPNSYPLVQLSVITSEPDGTPGSGTFDLALRSGASGSAGVSLMSDTASDQWVLVLQNGPIALRPDQPLGDNSAGVLLYDTGGLLRFSRAQTLESLDCAALSGYTLAPVIDLETATSSASLTSA